MPGQKFGPAWFPGLVATGLAICGLLLAVRGLRQGGAWVVLPPWVGSRRAVLGVGSVIAGLVFYVFAADTLGFYITGIVLLALWTRILGAAWPLAAGVAIAATVLIHLAFYKMLRIPLPWGLLERYAF